MPETVHGTRLTDAQRHVLDALDDAIEHMYWEFERDEYQGVSTCGMAHIAIPDGRTSFAQRARSLAESVDLLSAGRRSRSSDRRSDDRATESGFTSQVRPAARNRDGVRIDLGGVDLSLTPGHRHYRLSITNISDIVGGPEFQRLDLQERLHRLILERLQYDWDYLADARVSSRVD